MSSSSRCTCKSTVWGILLTTDSLTSTRAWCNPWAWHHLPIGNTGQMGEWMWMKLRASEFGREMVSILIETHLNRFLFSTWMTKTQRNYLACQNQKDRRNIWHFNMCLLDGSPAPESQHLFSFLCLHQGNKMRMRSSTEIILWQLTMQ